MTEAAGVLLICRNRVLAISRGLDRANLGFPGGRADAGDLSARHTAARELQEETGIVVNPGRLRYVTSNETPSGGIYVLYTPTEIVSWPKVLRSNPFEGYVDWHGPEELLSPRSRHAKFHQRVLARF